MMRARPRHVSRYRLVMIIAAAVWVGAFLYYALGLAASVALGDFECPDSLPFSTYGTSSWQWWPPGVRCAYPGGDPTGRPAGVVSPPTSSAVYFGILVATFGGLVLAERRHRRSGARRSGGPSDSGSGDAERGGEPALDG